MISKNNKLSKKDFDIFSEVKKKKVSNNLFSLLYNKKQDTQTKISVIISKKTIKKATDRNRIKRIVFGVLKPLIAQKRGFLVVIYPKKEAISNQKTFKKELQNIKLS